jgi:hypothetical protein
MGQATSNSVNDMSAAMSGQEIGESIGALSGAMGALIGGAQALASQNEDLEVYIKNVTTAVAVGGAIQGATQAWTEAQKLLNIAMAANPVGVVIGAVAALAAGVYFLIGAISKHNKVNSDLYKSQKLVNDALKEGTINSYEEIAAADLLVGQINNLNDGSERRKDLIEEFNTKFGAYSKNLLTEKSSAEDIAAAYKEVNDELIKRAQLDVLVERFKEELTEQKKIEASLKILNTFMYDFLENKNYLKKDGKLWLVINKNQGAKSLLKDLEKEYNTEVIDKNKGFDF